MDAYAYSIRDKAKTLAYEARRFPTAAETALAWLDRAEAFAERRGLFQLADEIRLAAAEAATAGASGWFDVPQEQSHAAA